MVEAAARRSCNRPTSDMSAFCSSRRPVSWFNSDCASTGQFTDVGAHEIEALLIYCGNSFLRLANLIVDKLLCSRAGVDLMFRWFAR